MPSDSKKKEMQRKKDARNKKVTGTSSAGKKDENVVTNGTNGRAASVELTVSQQSLVLIANSLSSHLHLLCRKKSCSVRSWTRK